jgi:hypothetical protein
MMILLLLSLLGLSPLQEQKPQEKPKVPKDSIELVLVGCLKGRVLAVSETRTPDAQSGPDVRAKSFRLAGKKDVMNDVKENDNHLVEVTGIVKRSALSEPGVHVGKGVVITGGRPVAGTGSGAPPPPTDFIPVMDVESVRTRSSSCAGS